MTSILFLQYFYYLGVFVLSVLVHQILKLVYQYVDLSYKEGTLTKLSANYFKTFSVFALFVATVLWPLMLLVCTLVAFFTETEKKKDLPL